MPVKQVYKSKDFDKYLDGKRLTQNGKKALFKVASKDNTTARQKYVPIATRATIESMRLQVIAGGNDIELSSINYKNTGNSGKTRYEYEKPNGDYKIRGKTIPANTNAGKHHWYEKAHADNEAEAREQMQEAIHD